MTRQPRQPLHAWRRLAALALLACAALPALAGPSTLFQAIGNVELASFDLGRNGQVVDVRPGRADRVDADGGKVYWKSGNDIYVANPDFSGARVYLHTAVAALDFAVDAAAQRFYVSLPGVGLRALDLRDPAHEQGVLIGDYPRVTAAGGKVFAGSSDGKLYQSDANLQTLKLSFDLESDGRYDDLAFDATAGLLYAAVHRVGATGFYALAQFRASGQDGLAIDGLPWYDDHAITSVTADDGVVAWAGASGLWVGDASAFTDPGHGDWPAPPRRLDNYGLTPSDISLMRSDAVVPPTPTPAPGGPALLALMAAAALAARRLHPRPRR